MLYSVRMRAAQGAAHEAGGRHISGAERLVRREQVAELAQTMLERAFTHSRGQADFINITVEAVPSDLIYQAPLLPVTTIDTADVEAGRTAARRFLAAAGVKAAAVEAGLEQLLALPDSMRGAMLVCAQTGKRLDDTGLRGIRVSRMDISDETVVINWLGKQGLGNVHVREALVLAAKVVSAPGMIAEICWSDDPEYTAGYVASTAGYFRFPHLKPYGNPLGGRLFFVRPDCDITALIDYLEKQPVLVIPPEEAE